MARNYLIHCASCGAPRHAQAKNTRFCTTCRFLSDLNYWHSRGQSRECTSCGSEYRPFHSEHKLCHKCAYTLPEKRGVCGFCNTDDAHLIHDHPVCFRCVQDPALRPRILRSLEERQRRQRDEHGDKIGRPPVDLRRAPSSDREAVAA